MRDGKWGYEGERNRARGNRSAGDRYLRSPAQTSDDPQLEAKDARRNARERAQLWKTIKAEN
jgi:hypothetical protein